jgi:hypothetical protein
MRIQIIVFALVATLGHAAADDKQKQKQKQAQNQVDRIRLADPPQTSTGTKQSPVGQPIYSRPGNPGYKPEKPPLKIKEPPPPAKKK